jgi:hypothetical protein
MSNKAYNPTADFDAVIDWVVQQEKAASSMPDLDHGRPVTPGDRAAEHSADISKMPGGGIDHAKDQSETPSADKAAPFGTGLDQTMAGDTNPSGDVKKVTYRGTGDTVDDKEAAELATLLKEAADLDKLLVEAGVADKTAGTAGTAGTAAAPPADDKIIALVQSYKAAGEERAVLLSAMNYGFQTTYAGLHKHAADGTLEPILKQAEDESEDSEDDGEKKKEKKTESEEGAGDEGGGEGGGPPKTSPTDAGPAVPAEAPPPPPDAAGGGLAGLGGGAMPPIPMGPDAGAAGGMGGGMGGGGGLNEMAASMQEGGMDPHMLAMLLQQILGQMPPDAAPAKMAAATQALAVAKAVSRHVMTGDYVYTPAKDANVRAFRDHTRKYIREQLQAAQR